MSAHPDTITLSGDVGPDRLRSIESSLIALLTKPRPQVDVRFVDVGSVHLGVVNVLVKARNVARSRRGDINVIVEADSQVQSLLTAVGIVGTMRP